MARATRVLEQKKHNAAIKITLHESLDMVLNRARREKGISKNAILRRGARRELKRMGYEVPDDIGNTRSYD